MFKILWRLNSNHSDTLPEIKTIKILTDPLIHVDPSDHLGKLIRSGQAEFTKIGKNKKHVNAERLIVDKW